MYLSLNRTSPGKLRSEIFKNFFCQQQIVDYRVRAGAGAAILTGWSRSLAKMKRLHNTASDQTFSLTAQFQLWQAVLWSRSNLDRLRYMRPAPAKKIFLHKLYFFF